MRILMAATGEFALPTFAALPTGGHEIVALITQPDRPAGRGRHVRLSAIKQRALDLGVAVLQPERIAAPPVTEAVAELAADVLLVVAYGQKIPAELCALPPEGAINLHGSLLPELRGAAPCNWAVIRGYKASGVTVQCLAERIDAGDVLGHLAVAVGPRETAPELHDRLAALGAGLVLDVLARLESGTARAEPQDESRATFAPRLKKEDGLIDWRRPARQIDCLVRGVKPWPGAYTHLVREGQAVARLILDDTFPLDEAAPADRPAGTIVQTGQAMLVATGEGLLEIRTLKPESGKVMSAAAFCNGHDVRVGDLLGPGVAPA